MKYILRTTIICILLSLIIPPIVGWNVYSAIICHYYFFLVIVWLCVHFGYLKRKHALVTMPAAIIVTTLLAHIFDSVVLGIQAEDDNIVLAFLLLPGIFMLPASILGSIAAGLLKGTKWLKVFGIILLFGISVIFIFKSEQWFEQWLFYLEYRTVDGIIHEQEPEWIVETEQGNRISNQTFEDKILVLDFWNTGCGICFKKFPILDSVQKAFKADSVVRFYAINIPMEQDSAGVAFKEIRERGYTFNVAIGDTAMPAAFGFNGFPTVYILRNDSIIYRGNLEKAIEVLKAIR
jgi:thiol-disulfide isomerase/thioredoxin